MVASNFPLEVQRVDEPQAVADYADVLSQVASARQPLVVRRNGEDLAAVFPLEYLELFREFIAWQEAERVAASIDLSKMAQASKPPQSWFDDELDNPFLPLDVVKSWAP